MKTKKLLPWLTAFGCDLVAFILYWLAGKDIPKERGPDAFCFVFFALAIFIFAFCLTKANQEGAL